MFTFLLIDWVFFTLLFLFSVTIIVLLENESIGWSHTLIVGLVCLIAYKFNYTWHDFLNNPFIILKYIAFYLIFGIGWAFGKWVFYLKNIFNTYNDDKKNIISEIGNDTAKIQKRLYETYSNKNWKSSSKSLKIKMINQDVYEVIPPQANDNKSMIVSWITHWPFSMFWTLLNDPIRKMVNHIFNSIKSIFQKISDSIFKSAISDFNDPGKKF